MRAWGFRGMGLWGHGARRCVGVGPGAGGCEGMGAGGCEGVGLGALGLGGWVDGAGLSPLATYACMHAAQPSGTNTRTHTCMHTCMHAWMVWAKKLEWYKKQLGMAEGECQRGKS